MERFIVIKLKDNEVGLLDQQVHKILISVCTETVRTSDIGMMMQEIQEAFKKYEKK